MANTADADAISLSTYNYTQQYQRIRERGDPMLKEVLQKIEDSGASVALLARRSGVSAATIHNWRKGKTRCPQNITMEFALRAAGYRRQIVKA